MRAALAAVVLASAGTARADTAGDYIKSVAVAITPRWHELFHPTSVGPYTVVVRVVVTKHGAVREVELDTPSGLDALDAAALQVFRDSHLPEPPPGADEYEFLFPITVTGWNPPRYSGNAEELVHDTRGTDAGVRFELAEQGSGDARFRSETIALSGTQHLVSSRIASYAVTVDVPYRVLRYRDASTATALDRDGPGDVVVGLVAAQRVYRNFLADFEVGVSFPSGDAAREPIDTARIQLGLGKVKPVLTYCIGPVTYRHVTQVCAGLHEGLSDTVEARYTELVLGRRLAVQFAASYEHRAATADFLDDHYTLFAEAGVWTTPYRGLVVQALFAQRMVETTSDGQLGDRLRFSAMVGWDFARP